MGSIALTSPIVSFFGSLKSLLLRILMIKRKTITKCAHLLDKTAIFQESVRQV